MNKKVYLRRLLIIAVPIMLSNIISQIQMLIDRIFLGRADNLYMSALSNATTPMWTTMSFCFALVAGASISIYLLISGINTISKSANIIIGNGIRGSGDTKWMLYTQIFGTLFMVSVAAFLVYVCKLGIIGVFLAVLVDEAVRAIINFSKYMRIVKNWGRDDR